jgi:hypothetical protein
VAIAPHVRRGRRTTESEQVMEEFGVVIRHWSCPIGWHRSVKWIGEQAFCIEPGCSRSNIEPEPEPEVSLVRRTVMPVPRGVVTINLPSEG